MWSCPLGERVGKGEAVVITTAEREGVGPCICLCAAQLPPPPAPGPRQEAAGGTWPCATFQHCLPSPSGCAGTLPPSWPCWDISQAADRAVPLCPADDSKPEAITLEQRLQWRLGLGPGSPVLPWGTGPSPPPPTLESCQHLEPVVLLEALAPCALAGDTRTPRPCSGTCQGCICHLHAVLCPEHPVVCQAELPVLGTGTG